MNDRTDIPARIARLEGLLESRFGARRGGLARRSAKVGRELPRAVRRDLDRLSQAETMLAHPKLALRVDKAALLAAADRAEAHLTAVDARDRRRGRLLGMLAALVFNLLLLGVILLVLLRWRGLV